MKWAEISDSCEEMCENGKVARQRASCEYMGEPVEDHMCPSDGSIEEKPCSEICSSVFELFCPSYKDYLCCQGDGDCKEMQGPCETDDDCEGPLTCGSDTCDWAEGVNCCIHAFKLIEVEEDSWTESQWNEQIGTSDECESLCRDHGHCNAYRFDETNGCCLGNATSLVGANTLTKSTIIVHVNASLVPGKASSFLAAVLCIFLLSFS